MSFWETHRTCAAECGGHKVATSWNPPSKIRIFVTSSLLLGSVCQALLGLKWIAIVFDFTGVGMRQAVLNYPFTALVMFFSFLFFWFCSFSLGVCKKRSFLLPYQAADRGLDPLPHPAPIPRLELCAGDRPAGDASDADGERDISETPGAGKRGFSEK